MVENLNDSTVVGIVVMCVCALVVIIAFFLLHQRISAVRSPGDGKTIHFLGPDQSPRTIALDALRRRDDRRGSDAALTGDRAHLAAMSEEVVRAVERQCPGCFLAYMEEQHHVRVEVDLGELLRDPELIAHTAKVPLHATPYVAVEDDDSDTDAFDNLAAAGKKADGESAAAAAAAASGLDPANHRLPLVAPRIYPNRDDTRLVTSRDKISVCANRYVHAKDLARLADLPSAALRLLDAMYLDFAKKKATKERSAAGIKVKRSTTQVEKAPEHAYLIADVAFGNKRVTVVAVPSALRVCWGAEASWIDYSAAFTLPLGKWCVRAEALNRDRETCCRPMASAQVFTVEQELGK